MTLSRRTMFANLALDLIAPLLVFYGLRASGVSQWWSLLLSAVVPAAVVVMRWVRSRQVEFFAVFILSVVALGLVLAALTSDPRTMLVRDSWTGMLGGLIGVWLLASVFYGKPALMYLFRGIVVAKVGVEGHRTWESRWDDEPEFRHGIRVMTVVYGLAALLNACVDLATAYLLPIDLAPAVLNFSWPVIAVPLLAFHLIYLKKKNLAA